MEVKAEIVKQICEKCGKEDIAIVVTPSGRRICCDCDFEEKDITKNIVRFNVSLEVNSMIRILSERLGLPISSILREVLANYKNKSEVISKIDTEDYSKRLSVKLKNNCSVEEYQEYANKISNQDIISILKKLYKLKKRRSK